MTKEQIKNKICMWLAHAMPKRVAYWCNIRIVAYATTGRYRNTQVDSLPALDAGDRFYHDFLRTLIIKTQSDEEITKHPE